MCIEGLIELNLALRAVNITANGSPEIPDSFRWFRRFFPDDGQKIPDGCSWNDTYE